MEHKAFLFDYERFELELLPILEASLATGGTEALRSFIWSNLDSLTDPYEGEPLDGGWERIVEARDVHQYGDLALTK